MVYKFNLTLFIFLIISRIAICQVKTPLLERLITISLADEQPEVALNKISKEGKFSFSYNPDVIDVNSKITLDARKESVREVLEKIFRNKIKYTVKGNYVILQRKPPETLVKKDEPYFEVKGYLVDDKGEKLSWVSLYDKKYLTSAVSNEYGFYKLRLKKDVDRLYISKQGFRDTMVLLNKENQFLTISLERNTIIEDKIITNDSVVSSEVVPVLPTTDNEANELNIKDSLSRKFQISFIPFAGSNGLLSANVINDYSFNVLGGISKGTNKFELGGLFNINRGNVSVAQIAGLANAVGGNVSQLQIAGLANAVKGNVSGFQVGGLANAVGGKMKGIQIGGLTNVVQDSVYGLQIGGLANINHSCTNGAQIAGLTNVAQRNFSGIQISGLVNYVRDTTTGLQLGFVNYSKIVKGSQIGFFNYAKSISGVPFGFMSYVNSGYHKLEISADELFYTNIAFRSGVNWFHNILLAGIQPDTSALPVWTFGYGIGSSVRLGKNVLLDADITSQQIVKGNDVSSLRLNNKAYLGIDVSLTRKFSLFAGVTYNGLITERGEIMYSSILNKLPDSIANYTIGNDYQMRTWFGWKAGIRFF